MLRCHGHINSLMDNMVWHSIVKYGLGATVHGGRGGANLHFTPALILNSCFD